jgi:hypothetical protein
MRKWILLVLLVCGCGHARLEEHRTAMPVAEVPKKLLKAAHERFSDVKFDTAWNLDTGAIELRGKNKIGKIHEVEVSDTGKILEAN